MGGLSLVLNVSRGGGYLARKVRNALAVSAQIVFVDWLKLHPSTIYSFCILFEMYGLSQALRVYPVSTAFWIQLTVESEWWPPGKPCVRSHGAVGTT